MTSSFGKITGTVIDAKEAPIVGKQINLCPGNSATVQDSDFTDQNGWYCFTKLLPGDYVVRQADTSSQETPGSALGIHFQAATKTAIVAGITSTATPFVNAQPSPGTPVVFSLGGNVGGSPVPQTLAAFAAFKMKRARVFTGDNLAGTVSAGTLSNLPTYQAAGLQTNLVFHFGSTGNKAPINVIAQYANSIPTELVKGQWGEYGNELDLTQVDTPANYVKGLQYFSAIWRSKGGLVVLGNISRPNLSENWNFYQQIFAAGAAKFIDAWGFHVYPGTAAEALPFYDQAIAECQKQGVACYCTEGSFHNVDAATAATQGVLLIEGLKSRKLMFDYFPVGWTDTGAAICSLLNQDGTNHEPVYSAVLGATK